MSDIKGKNDSLNVIKNLEIQILSCKSEFLSLNTKVGPGIGP